MAIAAELQDCTTPGERAVLLFPPGLDFISAFFGCMYAGVIAVPAPIPNRSRLTTAVAAIFQAARPAVVLSMADHTEQARQTYASQLGLSKCPWIAVDQISTARRDDWHSPLIEGRQIAFLQYTSGSTSHPKGVMLSHDNLLFNAKLVQEAFNTSSNSHAVFWLPLYHDMGLIGGVIQPVFCGGSATLMAPAAFLQRPALWLEAISRTRASISGGPDFAYDLCARKVSADVRSQLDLSCWNLAFVGAERHTTPDDRSLCRQFWQLRIPPRGVVSLLRTGRSDTHGFRRPASRAAGRPQRSCRRAGPKSRSHFLRRRSHVSQFGRMRRKPDRAANRRRRSAHESCSCGGQRGRDLGPGAERCRRLF